MHDIASLSARQIAAAVARRELAVESVARAFVERVQAAEPQVHAWQHFDAQRVLAAARETGRIVVAEEHLLHGGLGSAVAMSAARQHPVPMRFVGIKDTFAESGPPEALLAKYGLTASDIVREALTMAGK